MMNTHELLEEIIGIINPREKATQDRLRQLNGRLRDKYTPDDILNAAHAFSKSQWHKENGQMSVDNLLRPSKFGRWYTVYMDNKPSGKSQDEMVMERME